MGSAQRCARWGWIAAAWGAVFAFDVTRHAIEAWLDGRAPSFSVVDATGIALWAVLTPLLLVRERARSRAHAALDRALVEARLRVLEAQLQPHFLFDALRSVGALVDSERSGDAARSLAALGRLLRATLEGAHEHALGDELELLRRYLELQQLRYGERLIVELAIPPAIGRARVPRMILQPLLDNAICHGVERSPTPVTIEVRAAVRDGALALSVRDRGGERRRAGRGPGLGLATTRARLAALYGDAHQLAIASTEGGGLAVDLTLPFAHVSPPAVDAFDWDA